MDIPPRQSSRSAWSWLRLATDHDRHLFAFYSYAWACEVFSLVSGAVFIPILLEHLARSQGYLAPNHDKACPQADSSDQGAGMQVCHVSVFGWWMDTASYSLGVKSASVAVQAVTVISISVLADVLLYRRKLLLMFAGIGALATMLYLILPLNQHISLYLAALLSIVALSSFGDSFVCLNAYLGLLVAEDEEVRQLKLDKNTPIAVDTRPITTAEPRVEEGTDERISLLRTAAESLDGDANMIATSNVPVLSSVKSRYEAMVSLKTTRISSMGIAIGYTSGVSVLCLSLIPIVRYQGSLESLQTVIGLTGLWWALFTIPAAYWLNTDAEDDTTIARSASEDGLVRQKIGEGWYRIRSLFNKTEVGRLKSCYSFLLSWAFLADAFNTTTAVAILFAKTTLHMAASRTILIGILTQSTAIASAMSIPYLQRRLEMTVKSLLVASIMGTAGMCLWGLVALRNEREMYAAAVWFGLMFGPFNSLSRSVFSELVPSGHNARFFSLFSITDKGASWLGPAAVALIADRTGNIRHGFWFLLIMLILPLPVLLFLVDMDRGKVEAERYSKEHNIERVDASSL